MIDIKQAKKILPKSEFERFEAVLNNHISRTSRTRLMQHATVSRRLRDKYHDKAKRMGAQAKRSRTNTTDLSQDLARVKIYNEIINRISTELSHRNPT